MSCVRIDRFEQLLEAVLPVLAVLDFRKIDRVVELPDRPAELDAALSGRGWSWRQQYCAQQENRTEAMAMLHLLCALSKMDLLKWSADDQGVADAS
jgi:hypothetical protein